MKPGSCELNHNFIVCKSLLHAVILGLDFEKCFRVGINWNGSGPLYLHQDHKPLTYLFISGLYEILNPKGKGKELGYIMFEWITLPIQLKKGQWYVLNEIQHVPIMLDHDGIKRLQQEDSQ